MIGKAKFFFLLLSYHPVFIRINPVFIRFAVKYLSIIQLVKICERNSQKNFFSKIHPKNIDKKFLKK